MSAEYPLISILDIKISEIEELTNKLRKIKKKIAQLEDKEKAYLPTFDFKKQRFTRANLEDYLRKLDEAVKKPIRFRRKEKLRGLGVRNLDKLSNEIFDEDEMERTIELLDELKKAYDRLFNIISRRIVGWITEKGVDGVNSWLQEKIISYVSELKKLEDLRSDDIKDYLLELYLEQGELSNLKELYGEVKRVESIFANITIGRNDIKIVKEINELLSDIEEFGVGNDEDIFREHIRSETLNGIRDDLKKLKAYLEERRNELEREIDYWCKFVGRYKPETNNIKQLKQFLDEIKNECKEKHLSYYILEKIYRKGIYSNIDDINDFSKKADLIVEKLGNLQIREIDMDTIKLIEDAYYYLKFLEDIEYPYEELIKDSINTSREMKTILKYFIEKAKEIEAEYNLLKRRLKVYQKILGEKTDASKYLELKNIVDEYRKRITEVLGKDFENIIRFLLDEEKELRADLNSLSKFLIKIKPLLKEVLGIA